MCCAKGLPRVIMVDNASAVEVYRTAVDVASSSVATTQQAPLGTTGGRRSPRTKSTSSTRTDGVEPAKAFGEKNTTKRSRQEIGVTTSSGSDGSDDDGSKGQGKHSCGKVAGGRRNAETRSDNLAILQQTKAEIGEALVQCEELVGTMEQELLGRQPNVMSMTSLRQRTRGSWRKPKPASASRSPSRSRSNDQLFQETESTYKLEPRERIFSQSSRTSTFWRSPVSRRRRTGEYRHGIDSPPVGCYAGDGTATGAQQQRLCGGGGEEVVAYDGFRRQWVPVHRRYLEQLALVQARSAGMS